jgi:integration host factor subunit alpha
MSKSVSKNFLAEKIFYEMGIPVSIAEEIVDTLFKTIVQSAKTDGEVKISNFGSFYTKDKKARIGRNLNTGEEVSVTARKVVSFQASANLKKAINEA